LSKLVLNGDTSGSVTLDAPAISGTTTLTLPTTSGTVVADSATQTLTNKTLTSPILTAPDLGTPTAIVLTNATGTANSLNAGLGVNQSWTNVLASRAIGTTYTNSSGKAIAVSINRTSGTVANSFWNISVGGVSIGTSTQVYSASAVQQAFFIVPSGATYVLTNGGGTTTPTTWAELR
jgi:hypothetical protein